MHLVKQHKYYQLVCKIEIDKKLALYRDEIRNLPKPNIWMLELFVWHKKWECIDRNLLQHHNIPLTREWFCQRFPNICVLYRHDKYYRGECPSCILFVPLTAVDEVFVATGAALKIRYILMEAKH
ncbi:MAG: hypothetical protein ACI4BH_00590 [Muribaculaceae bacterium]